MTRNPLINALAAGAYVALVATFISSVPEHMPIFAVLGPLMFLSLFVFSAALMGYLVVFEPLVLVVEGQPRQGVMLFLKTIGLFAVVVAAVGITTLILL